MLATAGTAVVALGAFGELPVALLASAVFGAAVLGSEALATAALGRFLPGPLVAPAFGLLDALMVAAMIVGATAGPVFLETVGMRSSLLLAGVAVPLLVIGGLRRSGSLVRPSHPNL
jgi:hypothetical protein